MTVKYLGNPDLGVVAGSYIGSLLLAGAYLAITCLTSALTRNQVVAFIISVVVCLFLILAGWPPVTNILTRALPDNRWIVELVSAFSVMTHFEDFQRGVVDSRHLLFFLSVIGFSLFSTSVVLRGLRS
jgi:ABC-2 type transport system permease protein